MDQAKLRELLNAVATGQTTPDVAAERLKTLPFEDIGFAKVDHHRHLRQGYYETIFAAGKTPEHVAEIAQRMRDHGSNVLATRCTSDVVEAVLDRHHDAVFHEAARCITITVNPPPVHNGYVAITCAGTSDIPVAEEAAVTCEFMGNKIERVYDIGVAGLHRLLGQQPILSQANCIVVCAGMEGALASVVAGLVNCPVIAVPTSVGYGASFSGLSALLTMLNSCASGVAVVNIDNGFGAGAMAAIVNRMANGVRP